MLDEASLKILVFVSRTENQERAEKTTSAPNSPLDFELRIDALFSRDAFIHHSLISRYTHVKSGCRLRRSPRF